MPTVRDRKEFNQLVAEFHQCQTTGPQTVVIEGPAGSGKSALLDAFVEYVANSGATVLRAAAWPTDASLPLSLLRQLVTGLPVDQYHRFRRLLEAPSHRGEVVQELCLALHELAASSPVVIGVDDVHRADLESLRYLRHLAGRLVAIPLLVVLTESSYASWNAVAGSAVLRRAEVQRLWLGPLGPIGVHEVLAGQGLPEDRSFVERCIEVTGGNPALLLALVDDHRSGVANGGSKEAGQPVVGETYRQAVQACVSRHGPRIAEIAAAVAVLGDHAGPESVRRLLGVTAAVAERGVRALNAAGVLLRWNFRHPVARQSVLDGMAPETRAAFHRTAARLLYGDGLPAAAVAALLRLAGPVGEPWEIAVLTDAAEAALRDDRARLALDYLQMAQDACLDEHRRLEIVIRRALISRRVNLHIAERQLAEPLRALRTGRLPVSQFGPLAKLLGAQGRVEEANEVIACLDELIDDGAGVEADSQVVSLWAATPYPPMVSVSPVGYRRRGLEAVPAKPAASTQREGELTAADELLAAIALTDTSLDLVVNSIKSLLCGGRVDRAELWCARFLAEADERQAPGWLASFSWVAAEIALRQGQLAVAEDRASTAIELVSEHSGGIFVAAPTATSVQAYLAMGEVEAAGRRLNLPVTDLLFKTKAGLNFRRARALYYAATNRPHVALEEFLAIGQVAKRWNFDQPLILPWRSDAAEALLRLGEAEQAGQLATEQLARSENADHWPRGVALRVRAMAAPASQRVSWLSQSEDELRVSGDRLELARTLADQAETYQSLGEFARAAAVKRRAWRLADECGAAPLRARLGVEAGRRGDKAVPGRRGGNDESALSDSERRVATLAACGETNRAIARKLYITLSTVEQHLTRVYRKLGISGRQELPSDLQFEADRIA